MPQCAQDSSFGPASTCRRFDFTLYFEQAILSFAPDIIFVVLATFRLWFLYYRSNKLQSPGWPLLSAKLVCSLLLIGINAAIVKYLLEVQRLEILFVWLPAQAMQLASTIPLGTLVIMEHFRSPAPSMLVICYALLKGLLSAVFLRSYDQLSVLSAAPTLGVLSALLAAVYLLLMCVELVEKRGLLRQKALSSVTTSSFLSRSIYLWLIPLLWTGRTKTLTIEDCDVIPEDLGAQSSRLRLEAALMRTKTTSHYLLIGSVKAFGLQFITPVLPRLILLLATFAQPILVNQIIYFVSDTELPITAGWLIVGGFICVYVLITLSTSLYWEKVSDATALFRAALVGTIYSKTLKLSSASSRSLGGGASTYMSVDVERICLGAEFFYEVWASVFSVALAIVLLYHQTSWPAFLPLVVVIILLVVAILIGRRVNYQQAGWLAATDKRVKFMSSIIINILPIKWAHYEEALAQRAAHLRGEEMEKAKQFYKSTAVIAALSNAASTFCILSVLSPHATLVSQGPNGLDIKRLFTIITTVNLLSAPLSLLGQSLPELSAAYASLMRIQTYLLMDERSGDVADESGKTSAVQKHPEEGTHQSIPLGRMSTSMTVNMDAASFSWTPQTDAYLRDITICLDRPALYICVGLVASGKSLLLLSILGESTQVGGHFSGPKGRIAYASQEALIVPGTIYENILFGKPYEAERYAQVLEVCALTKDLSMLPNGDRTFLGEKGCRLSGGQKQRIGLARAIYADAQWTLLDDPFSALDAEMEERIFMSLFARGGMLYGKAVLLVTHNVTHIRAASHVIMLEEGRVKAQGAPAEIEQQGCNLFAEGLAGRLQEGRSQRKPAVNETAEFAGEQEEKEEPIAKASLGFTPYLFFVRMATWGNTALCVSLLVLLGATRVGLQAYLREWSISDGSRWGRWVGGYAVLSVASLLVTALAIWQYCMVVTDVSGKAIHHEEVKGLFGVNPSYFLATPAGRIINRFSQDIFMIDLVFPLGCLNGLALSVILLGTLMFIFIPTPWLALSIFPLGGVYYFSLVLYLRTSKQLQHLEASSKSPLYTAFSTTLSGLETIRALRVQSYFQEQNDIYLNRSQVPFFFRLGGIRFLRTVLAFISCVMAVSLASMAVRLRTSVDLSFLGLALSNLVDLLQLLSSLFLSLTSIENGSIAISRIHEIVSLPKEENTTAIVPANNSAWPSVGVVVFQDVYLRYKTDLDPVLRGVSFRAEAGQKVGICGRSGSGKSSIVLALYRALDQSLIEGTIKIDGVDINSIPLSLLRKSLTLVAQDPFLWHSSLRDNLDPEHELGDEDIWLALKRIGMSDVIASLPDKLDSILEDKRTFSKGQCQLLCFARVLLRERKIVVLDEASSSLDSDTDEKIQEVIRKELANRTVIVVAHRIATIIDFDWILVMEDGIIVETGRPVDLLVQPSSRFARLASSQGLGLLSDVKHAAVATEVVQWT